MSNALQTRLEQGFEAHFGTRPDFVIRAPGRVNLIGEHTDYNGGFALPAAISLETQIAVRASSSESVEVAALDFGEDDSFLPRRDLQKSAKGGWRDYIRGSVLSAIEAGYEVPGVQLAVAGSIPKGTGLSSSASLEVGIITALLELTKRSVDPKVVALLAQKAENDFVGMRCGNLDQLASAATEAGAALLIDCRSLMTRSINFPEDAVILIIQSGVTRGLVEGEYNRRRAECEQAAKVLGVAALRDANMNMLEAARDRMDPVVFRRARHIITDNRLTLEAADALTANDLTSLGGMMRESHASQRDDFGITVPDTDRLADIMNAAIGGDGGARQTGGGFGGAVVGVLRADRLEAVKSAVRDKYQTPAGHVPDIYVERPHAGAGLI